MTRRKQRRLRVKRNARWRSEHRHLVWVELTAFRGPGQPIGTVTRRVSRAEFERPKNVHECNA